MNQTKKIKLALLASVVMLSSKSVYAMEGVENDPATSTRATPAPLSMSSVAETDEPSVETATSVQVSSSTFKRKFNIGYYVSRRDGPLDPPKMYAPRSFEKPYDVLSPSAAGVRAVGTSPSVSNN